MVPADGAHVAGGLDGVLVADQPAFESLHGSGLNILGTYDGSLDNGGEQLTLRDAQSENILSFEYDGDWFPPAREGGYSIEEYESLWDTINTRHGGRWEDNPRVWVIEFKIAEG